MNTYSNGISRAEFIAECEAHRAADRYMAGDYWRSDLQRGCAVGCAVQTVNRRLSLSPPIDSNDHVRLAYALGWPVWLICLQDVVFERLPVDQRADWPVNLAIAVPENVDLEPVLSRINARILRQIVSPIAGIATDVVQRVVSGLETDWINDDPAAAEAAAVAAAVAAAKESAEAEAEAEAAEAAEAEAAAVAAAEAAAVAAAEAAAAAAEAAEVAAAKGAVAAAVAAAEAAAEAAAAWITIASIVLEEVARFSGADPLDPEHWTDIAGYAHAAMRTESQPTTEEL